MKTVIGVLASHDDSNVNQDLAQVLAWAHKQDRAKLDQFHFLFTGGTFDRVVLGQGTNAYTIPNPLARDFVRQRSTRLPRYAQGGVTVLTNFVVQRQCSVVWTFLSPQTVHWLNPENLALMRLCDTLKVRRFLNAGSVRAWFKHEVGTNYRLNRQPIPLELRFGSHSVQCPNGTPHITVSQSSGQNYWQLPEPPLDLVHSAWEDVSFEELAQAGGNIFADRTIALIAHDRMKERMVGFAVEYEHELSKFGRVLTTGTTGEVVKKAARQLQNTVCLCRSGPLGGDIEIATEILYGHCDVVVFFIDPQKAHPHTEDIRALFAACMRTKDVLMFTNEEHARDWMNKIVRPNC